MLLRQFHQSSAGIDQRNARAHARECHRRALVNFDLQPVGHEAHHAGRFDPGNLFELRFLLGQRHEENVASDVGAHHFHDLRLGHILHADDFNVVAGLDAKAPGALAVFVQTGGHDRDDTQNCGRDRGPQQPAGSFSGSELRRAETRFCPRRKGDSSSTSRSTRRASSSSSRGVRSVQMERANARRWMGTTLPARWCRWISAPSVQVSCREESLSFFTIASFLGLR